VPENPQRLKILTLSSHWQLPVRDGRQEFLSEAVLRGGQGVPTPAAPNETGCKDT